MFGKSSCKIFSMCIVLSMISGFIAAMVVIFADKKMNFTGKCKKAFRHLEEKMM